MTRMKMYAIRSLEELDQKLFGDEESDEDITLVKKGEDVKTDK